MGAAAGGSAGAASDIGSTIEGSLAGLLLVVNDQRPSAGRAPLLVGSLAPRPLLRVSAYTVAAYCLVVAVNSSRSLEVTEVVHSSARQQPSPVHSPTRLHYDWGFSDANGAA